MCTHTEWIDGREISSTRDIDLHKYQCTQCLETFFYSHRAKQEWENGTYDLYTANQRTLYKT